MIRTAAYVHELASIGVEAPARPEPPFQSLPASPTPEELEIDRRYQARCVDWIEAVAKLHHQHFPG